MTFSLVVKKRNQGEAATLRASGIIPGVLYGPQQPSTAIGVEQVVFSKLYREAGESTLIDVSLDGGASAKALIDEVQRDPVKGTIIHVDFRQINMNKEMVTDIDLRFVGDAPAVKELGGTLVKPHEKLKVKCLPKDLVGHIDIDLGILKTFDDAIRASDVKLPAGMTLLDKPDAAIAKVARPLTEDELKALEAAAAPGLETIKTEAEEKREKKAEEAAAEASSAEESKKEEVKK